MSRSRSKRSKNTQLPLFIEKLIQMLDDLSIDNIISWTSTNDSFNIKSITQFTETILPKYFKHNNFSSFIRQLNMYGFRKIRHQDGENIYENQNLKRGNKALLKNIKRKINQQKDDKLALYSQQGPSNYTLSKQINQMKNKQKDLESICRHLLMQNQKLIDENNNLMKKMKDESRRKQKNIEQLLLTFINNNNNSVNNIIQNGHVMILPQNNTGIGIQSNNSDTTFLNPSTINGMLSIMSNTNSSDLSTLNIKNQQTPLQILSNAMSRNKNMRQFKEMLECYYDNDEVDSDGVGIVRNNINGRRVTRKSSGRGGNNNMNININGSSNSSNSSKNNNGFNFNINNNTHSITLGTTSIPTSSLNEFSPYHHSNESEFIHDDQSFNLLPQSHQHQDFNHDQNNYSPLIKLHHNEQNYDADGFIPINDFMNLQDENNINLQESN